MTTDFDAQFREWATAAGAACGLPPSAEYYELALRRLPVGLRTLLGSGLADGVIVTTGYTFALQGLAPGKGPYQWFSLRSWPDGPRGPHPNWEYFVQVAEYVRLHRIVARHGLTLAFEDDSMDLTLSRGNSLLVCVEVKVEGDALRKLIGGVKAHEAAVDLHAPDRGNDPLRKAKYLVRSRPEFFAGLAIGTRLEYRVEYPEGQAFRLSEDLVPWT